MPYVFDQIFAVDEANPQNVARNSSVLLYEIGDVTKTPVTITTPGGDPLPNPVMVNGNGFGPIPMHETLDSLAWEGGGCTGVMRSYDGMKEVAVASQVAAQGAQALAALSGEAAAAAQAAAEAAAATATGGGAAVDPLDADTLIITTKSDGSVITDPSDADALIITT
jgi:hypothetical protein